VKTNQRLKQSKFENTFTDSDGNGKNTPAKQSTRDGVPQFMWNCGQDKEQINEKNGGKRRCEDWPIAQPKQYVAYNSSNKYGDLIPGSRLLIAVNPTARTKSSDGPTQRSPFLRKARFKF